MFDARAAKALIPGNHLTVDGAPGLRLTATQDRRTWTYRFKSPIDGRMRQVRLGHWPAMAPAAAIAAWERARQQRAAGVDPAAQRRADRTAATSDAQREAFTVRALCDEYLAAYSGTVAPKTWAELERLFRVDLGTMAQLPASAVTRANAFDLLAPMRGRPVVARGLRRGLGAAWDHALDSGRLPPETPNWWRLVLRGKLPSLGKAGAGPTKRVLDEGEVAALLRWMPNFSRDVEDALTLQLWTCCRGAEVVAMERTEITEEVDGFWWTVPRAKLKMRRNPMTIDLRVPLVGLALAVAQRRLEAQPGRWLFPSPGRAGHIQQKALGVAVWMHMPYSRTRPEHMRPRLPVVNWAPHDLRRTGRTMLAALGCPVEVAEAILGHQLPGVQGVYDRHGYNAERRVWLTRLAERLAALA
jgi:integrase